MNFDNGDRQRARLRSRRQPSAAGRDEQNRSEHRWWHATRLSNLAPTGCDPPTSCAAFSLLSPLPSQRPPVRRAEAQVQDDHDESVQGMPRTPDAIRGVSRVDVLRRCDVFGMCVSSRRNGELGVSEAPQGGALHWASLPCNEGGQCDDVVRNVVTLASYVICDSSCSRASRLRRP